jgi:hypothetical protein
MPQSLPLLWEAPALSLPPPQKRSHGSPLPKTKNHCPNLKQIPGKLVFKIEFTVFGIKFD